MKRAGMNILIAGGGTGGHLFPGVAVAQAFQSRDPDNRLFFITTGRPFEAAVLSRAGFPFQALKVEGLKGKGRWRQLKAALKLPAAVWRSRNILRRFQPDLVMGVGAYVSGPVALAAKLLGIPVVIHEQNMLAGMTNRLVGRFADRVYLSFAGTRGGFAPEKVRVTGNPVRQEFVGALPENSDEERADRRRLAVLVAGGSQGAHRINQAVVEALGLLTSRDRFGFIHQTGEKDEAQVAAAYRKEGMDGEVKAFFVDMYRQYRRADLVICRAGATTVAEITAIGRAAIFVPFPFAADNHQEFNARMLAEKGAAEMILEKDLSGAVIAARLEAYLDDPRRLAIMAARARELGNPQAAEAIVEDCCQLVREKAGSMQGA